MRLWPRKRFGVFALDPTDRVFVGGPVYSYFRATSAASMARHLTILASCRHTSRRRPPLEYVARRLA